MPQISVIVPVFKTEKYLTRCTDSLLAQTFQDIEIILVDDGSPDYCGIMCDEYANKDSRVCVIHQKNAGVSAARNAGLDMASAEYVTFVDSDDWIEPCMYEAMLEKARQFDCDVVMCDCVKDFDDHSELYSHDIRSGYYSFEQLRDEYYPHLLMMENVEYPATISNCLCLFRRSLQGAERRGKGSSSMRELQVRPLIRYVEGVRFSEDLLFGAEMMYYASSFFYMKGEAYYHYNCQNQQSATHRFTADKWNDYVRLAECAETFFLSVSDFCFQPQIDKMILFFVYNAIGGLNGARGLPFHQKKERILSILNEQKVREMFARVKVLELPISWKLKVYTLIYKYRIGLDFVLLRG